jgi:hypothetical protein
MKINDNLAIGLEIKPSNIKDAGVGLFASTRLIKGVPLCEYKGDNLLLEQVEERYDNKPGGYALLHPAAKANSGKGEQLDVYIDCHPSKALSEIGLGGFINDKYNYTNRPTGYWDIDDPEKNIIKRNNKRLKYLLDNDYNVQYYPVPTQPYFLILSLRDIEPGEELYADYGAVYWSAFQEKIK